MKTTNEYSKRNNMLLYLIIGIIVMLFVGCPIVHTGKGVDVDFNNSNSSRSLSTSDYIITYSLSEESTIESHPVEYRRFPFVYYFYNKAFISFCRNEDSYYMHNTGDGMRILDQGVYPRQDSQTFIYADFRIVAMCRLQNGNLMALSYPAFPSIDTYGNNDLSKEVGYYWISSNQGESWSRFQSIIHLPIGKTYKTYTDDWGTWAGILFHRTLLQMPDGSLRATMYGRYSEDSVARCFWVKSIDMGANWEIVSQISDSQVHPEGYCEPIVTRCVDGSLLCVMRTGNANFTECVPLYQSRSYDDGHTWSAPATLPGIDPYYTRSVDPDLCLLQNGLLVLSYGRPDCNMLISKDGKGSKWEFMRTTRITPTTGMTGICGMDSSNNKLLLVGDNGDADTFIWKKNITINKVEAGNKIDLLSKYLNNEIEVTTDMNWSDQFYPAARISGAFDGTTEYFHAAFKPSSVCPSNFIIKLDKAYLIKTLGICLKPKYYESANIYFSADGINWGPAVKQYINVIQPCVQYTVFNNTYFVKYIRVEVTSSAGWPGLNEIELYYQDTVGEKIDLKSKYFANQINITTDMNFSNPNYPAGIPAAFDGSTEYYHSAFKQTAVVPSYYIINLDRLYNINALGICMKPGYLQSADIYFSQDGVNWNNPVKSYNNTATYYLDYTCFSSPIIAKYIKYFVTYTNGAPMLNEIELYAKDITP